MYGISVTGDVGMHQWVSTRSEIGMETAYCSRRRCRRRRRHQRRRCGRCRRRSRCRRRRIVRVAVVVMV